ncbi:hypothetical protein [Nitrosomonas oligotropha]|uniref:Uncharacterized protein n=1 Tax=Nitrosomonas oligotropha TaxID=42354 RepID=A0A1H8KGB1_9PROT|nr:hypothetical protein [Nitrosomonas oligotropha]SDW31447.1 hypothetical protein SAMN05216300_103115 [Nitrosomonas oligotropha]SEN92010.1 hypothetical protein SAMN05216333_102115 [Nitrosomonas oligotropha]
MEIFLTILAGAGTFVLGQIIMKLVIDPVQSLKIAIAEVANKLILSANIYANPRPASDEKQKEMSQEMRILSSKLQSNMHLIPCYDYTAKIFGLPKKEQIAIASNGLIFIHNGHDGVLANQGILNCYAAQKIRIALSIFIPPGEYLNPEHEKVFIKAKQNE